MDNEMIKNEHYEGRDLGLTYTTMKSIFKIWAPTTEFVSIALYEDAGEYDHEGNVHDHTNGRELPMMRLEQGVWSLEVDGDWNGYYYMYKIGFANGTVNYAVDPYAKAVSANGQRSAVVNVTDTDPVGWSSDVRPRLAKVTDAVIYELHIRDFSADSGFGGSKSADLSSDQGKYTAFIHTGLTDEEGNSLGIDHLRELGITHVHLLPVADFYTVNEVQNTSSEHRSNYNWGYDPQHYHVPEGSYSNNAADPAARIREFKMLVQALHAQGIGVIMDVVYNHMYATELSPFELIVPGYFYRTNPDGHLSNGSGVGNELATERPMTRKYIKDSLRYWAEEYHIDGFRFDLMGLMDTQTAQELTEELRFEIHPDIIIYGEPWTGGQTPLLNQTLKGTQKDKGFALFNDHYRSAIKGDSDGEGAGFATGAWNQEEEVLKGVHGAIHDFTAHPSESINYVTAHDNLNLWDKIITVRHLRDSCNFAHWQQGTPEDGRTAVQAVSEADPYQGIDELHLLEDETVRRSLLANGMILTAQGIPFLHAGDELLRSKYGDHNSYRSGDAVNAIRWGNKARFRKVFDYMRGLIYLRRSHPAFRMDTRELVERNVEVLCSNNHVVAYVLRNYANGDDWHNIVVIYNGSDQERTVFLPADADRWHVVVDDHGAGNESLYTVAGNHVTVSRCSMMVLYDSQETEMPSNHDEDAGVEVARLAAGQVRRPELSSRTENIDFPYRTIRLIYERTDGLYTGWNVWVWGTGCRDGHVDLDMLDDGRAVALIRIAPEVRRIGYIVRLNHWDAKDVEADRYMEIDPEQDEIQVLVRSGSDGYMLLSSESQAG